MFHHVSPSTLSKGISDKTSLEPAPWILEAGDSWMALELGRFRGWEWMGFLACLFKQRQSQMEHPEPTNRRQNLRNDKHAMLARCDVYIYIYIYIYIYSITTYTLVN